MFLGRIISLALILLLAVASHAAHAEAGERYAIPQGELHESLKKFSEQSGLSVVFDASLAARHQAPALFGAYTSEAALTKLLNASNLRFSQITDSIWAIGVNEEPPLEVAPSPRHAVEQKRDLIIVAGTRIARPDMSSPSPLISVGAADLAVNNTVNTEDFLNDLPQFVPSFDSTSNNPGDGTARVSLRGLGPQRTLVLIEGKRMVADGVSQSIDLNNIPASLVDRIDIVTGGASAVYGYDAVAGVVNFDLKDSFEGFEINATQRLTGRGDAGTLNLDAALGGAFADGRGSAIMAVSYTNRDALFQRDRDFARIPLVDLGDRFGSGGSNSTPGGRFLPNGAAAGFDWSPLLGPGNDAPPICAEESVSCRGVTVNDAGALEAFKLGEPNNLFNFAEGNYLQLPQERYNVSAFAAYEIADNIEAYGRSIFSHVQVDSQLAPTPANVVFTVEEDNPFLFASPGTAGAADLGALLRDCATCFQADTNGDGKDEYVFGVSRRYQELGARISSRDTNTFLIGGGLRGDVHLGGQNAQWDIYAQHGRSSVDFIQAGNLSVSAIQTAVREGRANIFDGPGSLQPGIAGEVMRIGAMSTEAVSTQVLATLSSETSIHIAPDRPVAVSAGLEYREERALQRPDSVLSADTRGFNQAQFMEGRFDTYEAFAELNMPLVAGAPFIQSFDINGAYRYAHHSRLGGINSFAAGGEWQIDSNIRLRAQFQRAVRAPSVSELFINPATSFSFVADPCDSFGNWGFLSSAQQESVRDACIADGVPETAVGGFVGSGLPIENNTSGYGAELEAEKANTITVGGLFTPAFAPGLTLTVDYYDISINNAIAAPSAQAIVESCLLFSVQSACALTQRDAAGVITAIGSADNPVSIANQSNLTVRGVDFSANYVVVLPGEWGVASWRFDGAYTFESSLVESAQTTFLDCAGYYGGACGQPTPKWKFSTIASWRWYAFTAALRYSWLSSVDDATNMRYDAYGDRRFVNSIGDYGNLDVNLNYDFTDYVTFSVGVDNILNPDAPLLGSCCSEQANTWPATYETLGRQFFLGAKLRF